jgi:nicotinate-nucleotide--dimethylbenzimidazole phosphoribosyltransferase
MTKDQAYQCVEIGIHVAEAMIQEGHDLFLIGEMGIGNTTSSTAMIACLLGLPIQDLVGIGSGISVEKRNKKRSVIESAIRLNRPDGTDPWDVLTKVGGFEIGAMAGAMIACANHRIPIILDGVIASTAALFAYRLNPDIKNYFIASHQSAEPAHHHVLAALGLTPLVNWGMHLGEASGALFVLPIIQNACKVMAETATFEDARVSNPHKRDEKSSSRILVQVVTRPTSQDFDDDERAAIYKVIFARRDIRSFLPTPIPDDVLRRILMAAHHGPSVGYMQPWNFILIRDRLRLMKIQQAVEKERVRASHNYKDLKRDYYLRLKVEGILQAPLTICVTNDPTRGGPHVLGRNTIPETDLMSTSCAIENMWLAARAEGIGMGWVSIYEKQDIREILNIPSHIDPVALLSIGYTAHFPEIPLLERVGWGQRLDMDSLIFEEVWPEQKEEEA